MSRLALADGEVHVWSAMLERTPLQWKELLSDDEKQRAGRCHSSRARTEMTVGRGLLRTILGAYLDFDPAAIRFTTGPAGKPELREPRGTGLHFNVSHSHGLALFAVTRCGPIGVDVEQLRPLADFLAMAERFFSPQETAILRSLPDEHRTLGFFQAWTRKEAFLKVHGIGLSYGLERVEVTIGPGQPPQLLRLDGDESAAGRWSFSDLEPAPGYLGAVVLEGSGHGLRCQAWPTG